MDFLFVTGMSGAGKTVAVNELEDMGYFCVDNIPAGLIGAFARLCEQSPVGDRIALVTDFRSGEQFARFPEALDHLTAEGHTYRILMLEAEDSVILRRYKENRRRHPLLEDGSFAVINADTRLSVNADSPHREEALRFVEFFTRPENIQKFADQQASFSPLKNGGHSTLTQIQPLIPAYADGRVVIGSDSLLDKPIWELTAKAVVRLLQGEALDQVMEQLDADAEQEEQS